MEPQDRWAILITVWVKAWRAALSPSLLLLLSSGVTLKCLKSKRLGDVELLGDGGDTA